VHGDLGSRARSYGRNDAGDAGIDAALAVKGVGRPVRVQACAGGARLGGRPRSTAPAPHSTRTAP